jgi:RNA polymerase sigma-70 factor (ECF subfamily)
VRCHSNGTATDSDGRPPAEGDALAAALAADLDSSFERLVLAYQDRLYAFALRLSNSPCDAEEIVQDALVQAYRALARWPAERVRALAPRPWLYQITLNVYRNRVRGRRLRVVPLDSVGNDRLVSDVPADPRERPEALTEDAERSAELAALVAALPERYRVAVVLRYVAELSYAESAALLRQPVGTVKSHVQRGLLLLREALVQQASAVEMKR